MEEKLLICRFPWGEEADVNPYAWMTYTLYRIGIILSINTLSYSLLISRNYKICTWTDGYKI
jgi:hypothetical protein